MNISQSMVRRFYCSRGSGKSSLYAFTLTELLVVIAVFGIMAALLLPAQSRAAEQNSSASCLNNLRQLGLAFETYKPDFESFYPRYHGRNWTANLVDNGYVKNPEVYSCPAFLSDSTYEDNVTNIDYGYNAPHIGSSIRYYSAAHPMYSVPARDSQIRNPAETLLAADGRVGSGENRGRFILTDFRDANPTVAAMWAFPDPRHDQSLNILWSDGRAASMPARDTQEAYEEGNLGYYTGAVMTEQNRWSRQSR